MSGWEFWIDVGGTFTDCLARAPDGQRRTFKTLSSAALKGRIESPSTTRTIYDSRRCEDPVDFWNGWTLRAFNAQGDAVGVAIVTQFSRDEGALHLASELPEMPTGCHTYELTSELESPLVGIRYLLGVPLDQPLPPLTVRLGTTRGTNALLTRRGGRVAWITTAGFGDLLQIGYQARPDLFALDIRPIQPLYECAIEIQERLDATGGILQPLDEGEVTTKLISLRQQGIESIAIGFMHAYRNPVHEQRVAQIARTLGFRHVSCSHETAALIKLIPRGDTTVADAYLSPVLESYVRRLVEQLAPNPPANLRFMTSAGGLVAAEQFRGKDSVLSGPAGGVVGFAGVAQAAGFARAIGFDMGGTSTDVARFDGHFEREYETEKAGVRLVTPMLAIETVAAGGGSICSFDGVKLTIGPDSAGADPGPACYGRGGPLTVTDLNVYLRRIPVDAFPFPLDEAAVARRLATLAQEVSEQTGVSLTPTALAEGGLEIANSNMAQAIRTISIAKGSRPQDYVLVAFGGAAPQHACAVARQLRIRQVLDHPDASLLSALGIGMADITRHAEQGVYRVWDDLDNQALTAIFAQLENEATQAVEDAGINADHVETRRVLEMRFQGTDWPLAIPCAPDRDFRADFHAEHQRLYGYDQATRPVEVVAARVEAIGRCGWTLPRSTATTERPATPTDQVAVVFDGQTHPTDRYDRGDLVPGSTLSGPALIVHKISTTVVPPHWNATVLSQGELLLTDHAPSQCMHSTTDFDPILLEIFHGRFDAIARQMGTTLRNISTSVNVKERLDFSCAVFTSAGELVVNAPHIPVHLGAMSETVKCVLADHPDLVSGDALITNDPFRGGSHLPDVTVITPVFDSAGTELRFLVASRAHHAEIGGITPGSMPPDATSLVEEGVLLRSFKLVEAGQPQWDALTHKLRSARYPSRNIDANLADVRAQLAANQQGVRDLQQLEQEHTWPVVAAYMGYIQSAAEHQTRKALTNLAKSSYEFQDHLDDGSAIRVTLDVTDDRTRIDFTGSAPVHPRNLNANRAIVTAAVMYVLRCLVNEPIPLNQGVLNAIDLVVPPGLLNPPAGQSAETSPAVAGGNVETSQRIVDTLLGALQLAAASQGTMNNFLFGDATFGYYETICGGAGATSHADGASAVHTHMTNTRLADPEVLENKYPIRVHQFAIRANSGGDGQHRGGDGVVREFEFLAPLDVSILSQRRGPYPPYGLDGGQAGAVGENWLLPTDRPAERLPGCTQLQVHAGDRIVIKTPGGGGFGSPGVNPTS
ncbi:MAG: hydantoinase B/oxoprolinase family protein [Planctomycetales bacterium]|nr:hydantoinase B/oxoprolinase family protein [Planctomycetales bacterium]